MPVQFLYTAKLSPGKLFIGTGPYAGLLLGGNMKSDYANRKITIGNEVTNDFKRFDFGLHNSLGIQFKNGLIIGTSYQIGLTKIRSSNSWSSKNYVLSFFIGYH